MNILVEADCDCNEIADLLFIVRKQLDALGTERNLLFASPAVHLLEESDIIKSTVVDTVGPLDLVGLYKGSSIHSILMDVDTFDRIYIAVSERAERLFTRSERRRVANMLLSDIATLYV